MASTFPGINPTRNDPFGLGPRPANPLPPQFDVQYLTDLQQQAESLHDAIMSNRCSDWGGYQYAVGQHRGLLVAINTFKDMMDQWRKYQEQNF